MKSGIFLVDPVQKMPAVQAQYTRKSEKGINPTYCDIEGEHAATISILIKAEAIADHSYNGKTLPQLIKDGNLDHLQLLIKDNPTLINALNKKGYAPLHYAAHRGHLNIVNALLKAGAEIDITSDSDYTALMYAASKNNHHIIKVLLSHGAKNQFTGTNGESLAQKKFKDIDNITLWTLTEKKQYQFNPHRHVKIWLSKNPSVFMGDENQLRLVKMKAACPNDEITLVYDSQLLSEDARCKLLGFCLKQNINALDVRKIIPQCNQESEQQLIKIYEDEISHLNAGGNLAAASDILRWLKPVYCWGTYSDLDVQVSTKNLPKTIDVYADILFNIGTKLTSDDDQSGEFSCSNDIIAIIDSQSKKIKQAHQYIINACVPTSNTPAGLVDISEDFLGKCEQYNGYLTTLRSMYLGQTPRQFRANIPVFVQCLKELHDDMLKKNISISEVSSNTIRYLLNKWSCNFSKFELKLYMDNVINSTGPGTVTHLFTEIYVKTRNKAHTKYAVAASSLSVYKPLFAAFSSSQALSLRMSKKDQSNRLGSDLSWIEKSHSVIIKREEQLNKKTVKIQKAWKNHLDLQEGRLMRLKARITQNPVLLNTIDENGYAPLHHAAQYNHTEIARYLIEEGADLGIKSETLGTGVTVLGGAWMLNSLFAPKCRQKNTAELPSAQGHQPAV